MGGSFYSLVDLPIKNGWIFQLCKRLPEAKYPKKNHYKSPSTTINIHAYPDANTPLVRDITQRVEMPGVADVVEGLEPHLFPSGYD